jgi:hypothetical protein
VAAAGHHRRVCAVPVAQAAAQAEGGHNAALATPISRSA